MTQHNPQLHVVLYQPEIPQNTGNVGRSCVALGAKLWLVRPLGFRLDEKRLRRAGLDYWQHLDYEVVSDWEDLMECLPSKRIWLLSKKATQCYTEPDYQPGDTLVFGCETGGLPAGILDHSDYSPVRIPIRQQVRSLNLASAVAVATFEVHRQWREAGLIPSDFPVQ